MLIRQVIVAWPPHSEKIHAIVTSAMLFLEKHKKADGLEGSTMCPAR